MAERLTKYLNNGDVHFNHGDKFIFTDDVLKKLAAYEDTGKDPEDVATMQTVMEIDHKELKAYRTIGTVEELSELVKAKQDGRLAVLPIPFGKEKEVYGIAEDDYDDEVPKSIVTIDCEELERVEIWPSGELVVTVDGWEIGQSDIGKTVFLTRKEAEAALKEGNNDN